MKRNAPLKIQVQKLIEATKPQLEALSLLWLYMDGFVGINDVGLAGSSSVAIEVGYLVEDVESDV